MKEFSYNFNEIISTLKFQILVFFFIINLSILILPHELELSCFTRFRSFFKMYFSILIFNAWEGNSLRIQCFTQFGSLFFFKFKSHWTWPTWRQPFDGRLNLILKLMMTKLSTVAVISPFWSAVEWGRNVFFIFTGFSFYASDGGGPSATALEHPLDSHRNSIRWSTGGFGFSLFCVCVCVCCPSGPAWNAIMKKLICNHKQRDGSVCSATTIIHGVPGFVFSSAPSAP